MDSPEDRPRPGGDPDPRPPGGDTDAPPPGGDTDAPPPGGDTDAPPPGGDTDAPPPGDGTDAPPPTPGQPAPEGTDAPPPTPGQPAPEGTDAPPPAPGQPSPGRAAPGGPDRGRPAPARGAPSPAAGGRPAAAEPPAPAGAGTAAGGTSYRQIMISLAAARATRDRERLAAENWYAEQCAGAEKAVHRQRLAVAETAEAVTTAEEAVAQTDDEATRLWGALRGRLGPRASARMGTTPEPGVLPGDRIRHPHVHLQSVRQLVAMAGQRLEGSRSIYPLLLACGVLGAVAGWLAGRGLRALPAHGGTGSLLHTLATLCLILAPLVGLVPAFFLLRRQDEKLTQTRMLVSIAAGLVVVCGMNLAF